MFSVSNESASNENRGGVAGAACDDIQHPIHPIDEIHIPLTAFSKHNTVPRGSSARGVRGLILRPVVGLDLCDHNGDFAVSISSYQELTEQAIGNGDGVVFKEGLKENSSHIGIIYKNRTGRVPKIRETRPG